MTTPTVHPFSGTTIEEAQNYLRVHMKKGVACPCCRQHVKVYKRPLSAPMARWLVWLVRTWRALFYNGQRPDKPGEKIWVDIRRAPVRGGDYAKLVHWGLVEQKPKDANSNKDTKDSGMWAPTPAGIEFVRNRTKVPSHVYLYDNRRMKIDDDRIQLISIIEALGKKYSYAEVMSADINVEVPL